MKFFRLALAIIAISFFSLNIYSAVNPPVGINDKLTTLKTSLVNLKAKLVLLNKKLGGLKRKLRSMTIMSSAKLEAVRSVDSIKKGSITSIKYDKTKLEKLAEGLAPAGQPTDGYGYKVANLQELTEVANAINTYATSNNLSLNVNIPTFTAIPSSKIKLFLKNNLIDISQEWIDLIKTIATKTNQDKAFEDKKFPEDFLTRLEALEKSIQDKFKTLAEKNTEDFIRDEIFNKQFNSNEFNVNETIDRLKGKRLMVRSTGKEDTQEVANAGGNESIANVEPTDKDILRAMGTGKKEGQLGVVSSYFGKKSFAQRLGIGDKSLFTQEPLTPVLIQEMIGEKQDGETDVNKIPRVGVMFTEEAEGGTYKTMGISTGITVIQSTYGHNEAVVNGLVPVDTYYATNDGYVYSALRQKTHRLVPTGKGLERIENPKEIQNIPALEYKTILNLKLVAKTLEEYYGCPMDIEFVYDPNTKTINIVQARPITYKKNSPPASYLKVIPSDKISGTTIGAAGGSLRFINKKEQIIVSETLGQALSTYIDMPKAKEVQCVITGEMAPATSHEATTFRGEGIPVIYISDLKGINTLLESDNFKIVIDPQQEALVNWKNNPENSLIELLATNKKENGWISYPIPMQASLTQAKLFNAKEPKNPENFLVQKEMFESLSDQQISELVFKAEFDQVKNYPINVSALLKVVKRATDKNDAKQALARIILSIQEKYAQIKKFKAPIDKTLLQSLTITYNYIIKFSREVKNSINKFDGASPQRLFCVRFLEAALKQDPGLGEIINGYSFAKLLKIIKEEIKIKKETPDLTDESLQLYKVSKLAFTDSVAGNWKNFVKNWQKISDPGKADPETSIQNQFNGLIIMLGKIKLLPIWLHTSFSNNYIYADAKTTGNNLLREFNDAKGFILELNQKMDDLESFDISSFEDPAKITKSMQAFNSNIIDYFNSDNFLSNFKATNNLGKLAGLKVMSYFVDKFDQTIKTIKGSQKFVDKDKVKYEKPMLEKYFDLFLQWVTLLSKQQIQDLCPTDSNELDETTTQISTYYQIRNRVFFKNWKVGNCEGVTTDNLNANPNLFKTIFLQYLAVIQDCITQVYPDALSEQQLKDNLFGSKGFNVSGFALGSKLQLSKYVIPKVLEDAFTSIHQNLLVIISQITSTLGLENIETPNVIKEFRTLVTNKNITVNIQVIGNLNTSDKNPYTKKFLFGIADNTQVNNMINPPTQWMPKYDPYLKNVSLIGIDMDINNLIYTYNMPLRGHSCFFKLIFNKNKNEATLLAEFIFQNEDPRMQNLEQYLAGKKRKAPEISYKKGKGNKSIIYTSPIKLGTQWYSPTAALSDLEILGNLTIISLE